MRKKLQVGEKINMLTLLERLPKRYWIVKCECGETKKVRGDHLRRRISCGCRSFETRFKIVSTEQATLRNKINHYLQSAKKRKIDWEIDDKYFFELITSNCYYCGSEPRSLTKTSNHKMFTTGIDRIDSNKGYTKNNCVPCCSFCNFAKNKYSLDEFEEWIERLIKFRTNENITHFRHTHFS